MRFIPTAFHGAMDYLMGIMLMVGPWLLGWNHDAEMWTPMVLGAGVIVYSMLTDYECGLVGVFPMAVHLSMDVIGGLFLAVSPWIFGFSDRMWMPHVILGTMEVAAGLMTQLVPSRGPKSTGPSSISR